MKTVTKAQFDYFCGRVTYWLDALGVSGYTVYFGWTDMDCSAQVLISAEGRGLTFKLPKKLQHTSRQALNHSALHESMHASLAYLCWLGNERCVSEKQLEMAEEAVVCKLTTLVSNLSKQPR